MKDNKGNPLHLSSLNHISVVCKSVEESTDFYQNVLGFVPVRRPNSLKFDGAWLFGHGIGMHLLQSDNPETMPKKTVINPKDNHISFQCESMGMVEKKLTEMGIVWVKQRVEEGGIYVDQLFFHDPDGFMNEICNCDDMPIIPLASEVGRSCSRLNLTMVQQQQPTHQLKIPVTPHAVRLILKKTNDNEGNPLHLSSLNHISVVCKSVEESTDFYQNVLGFVPVRRPNSLKFDGAWLFGYGIGIHLLQSDNPETMPKKTVINPKDNHISFQCESMGMVEKKLTEMGIVWVKQRVEEGGIYVDQLFFHDPDGFMIEICNCDNMPIIPLASEVGRSCSRLNLAMVQQQQPPPQQQKIPVTPHVVQPY